MKMKKLTALVLSAAMTLSLGAVNVFAGAVNSITVAGVTVTGTDLGTPVTNATVGTDLPTSAVAGTVSIPDTTTLTNVTPTAAGVNTIKVFFALEDAVADATDAALLQTAVDLTAADGKFLIIKTVDDNDGETNYYALKIAITDGSTPPASDMPAAGNVTGDGNTVATGLREIAVTVPTGKLLTFTLDPQGLMALDGEKEINLEDLDGGAIYPSANANVINNSTVPVKVAVQLKGVTTGGTFIPFTTDEAGTLAAVEADTNNNVLLYAVPSSADIKAVPAAAQGETPAVVDAYTASTKGYVITDTASTLNFVLDKADYTVTGTADDPELNLTPGTGHGTGIVIGGRVNPNADWTDFVGATAAKKVTVEAVFTPAEATEAEVADVAAADATATPPVTVGSKNVAGVPGLVLDAAATTVTADLPEPPEPVAKTIGFKDGDDAPTSFDLSKASITAGTAKVINFEFDGKDLEKITFKSGSAIAPDQYSFDKDAGTITFVGSRASTIKSAAAAASYLMIYVDGEEDPFLINLVA